MRNFDAAGIRHVALPFSDGLLTARVWTAGNRSVVQVPEVGLHCYGQSDSEAAFRLFTALLKYYRQLKAHKEKLGEKGLRDLDVLQEWMSGIEKRMTAPRYETKILSFAPRGR